MKQIFLLFIGLILISLNTFSQQALRGGTDIISPEIKNDNTVIFRFVAPNAKEVKITGFCNIA